MDGIEVDDGLAVEWGGTSVREGGGQVRDRGRGTTELFDRSGCESLPPALGDGGTRFDGLSLCCVDLATNESNISKSISEKL
jgi:hypothetical protein